MVWNRLQSVASEYGVQNIKRIQFKRSKLNIYMYRPNKEKGRKGKKSFIKRNNNNKNKKKENVCISLRKKRNE